VANEQIRNRTVGTKMTDSEYERLAAVAESEGQSLGEWCREVLFERIDGQKSHGAELTVLAEVLALRMILLNVHYHVAQGDKLTAEEMQELIERADQDKAKKAADRFAANGK
jgi:hypothetical protein